MLWKTVEQSEEYWEINGHQGGQKSTHQEEQSLSTHQTFEQKFERDEGISHADLGVIPNQGARGWPVELERISEGGVGIETGAIGGY